MIDRHALVRDYLRVRAATEEITAPLTDEDQQIQSSPDTSPVKIAPRPAVARTERALLSRPTCREIRTWRSAVDGKLCAVVLDANDDVARLVRVGIVRFSLRGHVRPTTRNFWAPHVRHQLSGVRLARDAT